MESARNGYDLLIKHLSSWLPSRVYYEDWESMDEDDLRSLYASLGVDATWIAIYVEVQPRFHEGRFKIAKHMEHNGMAVQMITDI